MRAIPLVSVQSKFNAHPPLSPTVEAVHKTQMPSFWPPTGPQHAVELAMTTPASIAARRLSKCAYVAPNELIPERMLPVTRHAPAGAYVGVGTERCFITAALNLQVDRAVMLDNDPRVVLYNHVNIAVLAGASHRAAYLHLRLHGTAQEVMAAIGKGQQLGLTAGSPIIDRPTVIWWLQQVRYNKSDDMHAFNAPPRPGAFANANYLYDDALYERIAALAQDGRMHPLLGDLGDADALHALGDCFSRADEQIALLDISNAWETPYLGHKLWMSCTSPLACALREDAVLMGTTSVWVDQSRQSIRYSYFGARRHSLETQDQLAAWEQLMRTLDRTVRAIRPLAHRIERIDAHLDAFMLVQVAAQDPIPAPQN